MEGCKGCLHFEVCKDRLGTTKYYDNVIAADNVEKLCPNFKDRTRFVELTCKVGDIIYEICERKKGGEWKKNIVKRVVRGIEIGLGGCMVARSGTTVVVFLSDLGKTVFLTPEAAEKALNSSENPNSRKEKTNG